MSIARPTRIAHVITDSEPYGGAQRNTFLTLRGLLRDGYDAELICGAGGPLIDEVRAMNAPVHVVSDLVRPLHPAKDFRTLLRLYQLFRSRKYDLVHTHSAKAGLLGRLAAWWAEVPVIVHTVHGYPFDMDGTFKTRLYASLERIVTAKSDSVVCVGEILRQQVSGWKMAPPEKVVTIHSGIDFSSYVAKRAPIDLKRELGLNGEWPIIGSIGHLVEAKAQHHLIESVGHLIRKYPKIKLLLVGEGPLRSFLERRIQDLGLSSSVSLLGERNDIADILSILDVYAMSSRREGVGRALTEAMYFALPVVVTAVGGVEELISHEKTGLLVPAHNSMALAAAIDRLVSDVGLARRLGQNAHQRVKGLMDSDKMVAAIEDLYERLTWAKFTKQGGPDRGVHCEPV
jgi:glycosyltransferase involved in cell wall biosynthesis